MDKIKKFLNKINSKERAALLKKIKLLKNGEIDNLDIKKIKSTEFYRLRSGKIRALFCYRGGLLKIIFISRRDDKTYKKLKKKNEI